MSLTNEEAPGVAKMMRRVRLRRVALAFALLGVLYVGTYLWNRGSGGYWIYPERDGRDRWSFGLSMHTAILWQPRFGYWSPYKADFLGMLYSPMIRMDRAYFHPSHYVSDPEYFAWMNATEVVDWHPRFHAEVAAIFAKR
jgi:hypothetical protein